MKYSDGRIVKLGDKVKLWDGCVGVVVCSIDTNEYSEKYTKEDWGDLKEGVLIVSDKGGLIHYTKADEDLKLMQ